MRKQRQMEELRRNQKRYKLANTLDNIGNGVLSLPNAINKTRNAITFGKNMANGMKQGQNLINAWKGAKAISDATKAGAMASTAGNVANTASTVGNAANTASTVGNTANAASTAGNVASTAGKVGGALSKAGPALGAVGGAISAGSNFAKGDHVNGALDIAKTGLMFVPGVGQIAAAAIQIGQMVKSAMDKKKQKALAKSQKQTNEIMQQAAEKKQENITQFDNDALASNTMPNQSMLAGPTSPVTTQSEQIMQDHLQTGLNEAPTSSNETEDTLEGFSPKQQEYVEQYGVGYNPNEFNAKDRFKWDMMNNLPGTPTGPAANINQGYMGTLPELGVENSTGGWGQNVLNAMDAAKGLGYGQDVIDAIPQGLNSGHADIAGLIDKYTINKPTTPDEVDLARKGEFNTAEAPEFSNYIPQEQQAMAGANAPSLTDSINQEVNNQPVQDNSISQIMDKYVQTKEPKSRKQEIIDNMMSKFRGGLGDLVEGYRDNAYTSFGEGDLAKGMAGQPTGAASSAEPKSFMNRLGEAIGTGSRLVSNPGVQGLVAGAIKGANTGDWGTGLEYGVNWAANKAKSDNYYKKLNPEAKRNPIFSNYDADDFKAYADYAYKTARTDTQAPTADWYYKQELASKRITPEEYNRITTAPEYDPQRRIILNQEKINTKATNDERKLDLYEENMKDLISYRNKKLELDNKKVNALVATYGPKVAKDLILAKLAEARIGNVEANTKLINSYLDGTLGSGTGEIYVPNDDGVTIGGSTTPEIFKHRTNAF